MNTYTITTFGPREYLRYRGFITEGELVVIAESARYPSIADIQRAVAAYAGLPVREMTSDRRARAVARPRQVAMYLAKAMTPKSLPEIGRRFRRDHTTVIHAIRQVTKRRAMDPDLDRDLTILQRDLEAA